MTDREAAVRIEFAAIADEAPFGLYVLDPELRFVYANRIARPQFDADDVGRKFEEIVASRWPAPVANELMGAFRRAVETGEPQAQSIWHGDRRGDESHTFEWALRRIPLTDGTLGVACYFHDVTSFHEALVERASAEAALRETNHRLQLALDAANMGAFIWYPQEDRTEPDARMLELFGLPPDGTINLAVARAQLIHPDDRERYADAVGRAMDPAREGRLREDIRVMRPDGERWISITARTEFVGEPPVPARLVGMVTDVTDRKRVEEALREREERLAESDRKKDEFLAILAHELRNPLAPIRTGVEVIRRTGLASGDAARVTEMMERQIGHMVRLIDDLLDISRITSGKIRLQRQSSELRGLVESAVEANRAAIATEEIQLSVDLPAEPIWLDVDPARFVQIVSNILHNAVKFTDRDGSVALSARVEDGALVLTVADTGVGMSRDALPRVFDLFMQDEETARKAPGGLGIGLALARRLVEMHGGAIDATSPGVGLGSTFTVWLPLDATEGPRTQEEPEVATTTAPRRVVVIDDNRDAADAAAMFVEDLGNEVRVAYDGESGVDLARSFRPDLVLLDLGMVGVDGFETCRRIRAELGSDVFLVALTGWGQDHDKRATALAGFDAHLTKPADPAALVRLISASPG